MSEARVRLGEWRLLAQYYRGGVSLFTCWFLDGSLHDFRCREPDRAVGGWVDEEYASSIEHRNYIRATYQ